MYFKKQAGLHPTKQTHKLKRLSNTRWACRYCDEGKAVEARGILCQVKSFRFLLLLVIFSRILSFTKSLSDQLQSATNDIAKVADLVVATIETLKEIQSNSLWDHLYKYTQDVAKLNNVPLPSTATTRPYHSKQLPIRLQSGIVLQSTGSRESVSTGKEFKVSLYFCILDSMLGELKCRFDKKNLEIM